jgi:hypothetical protein
MKNKAGCAQRIRLIGNAGAEMSEFEDDCHGNILH